MMKKGDIVVSRLSHLHSAIGYYERAFGTRRNLHLIRLSHKQSIYTPKSVHAVYRCQFQYIGNLDLINYINIL